jgi:hypothetical protein
MYRDTELAKQVNGEFYHQNPKKYCMLDAAAIKSKRGAARTTYNGLKASIARQRNSYTETGV